MAQWLRAPAALAEDLASIPSTHTVTNKCLQFQFPCICHQLLGPESTAYQWDTDHMQTKHPYTQNKNQPKTRKQGELVLVVHACNPSTWEAEAGGLRVQGRPGLCGETPAKNKEKSKPFVF